jgi:hypothetical protein
MGSLFPSESSRAAPIPRLTQNMGYRKFVNIYHDVDVETIADMPCYVAMEWPYTRIIGQKV